MKTECTQKGLSYDEKQQLRAEEIEAIEKAIEVLSSESVSGNAAKHLDLAQQKGAASLLQVFGHDEQRNAGAATSASQLAGVHRKVHDFLATEAQRLHSKSLALIA